MHPPEACREMLRDDWPDDPTCDRVSKRTKRPALPYSPPVDHHVRMSTNGLSWFCHCQEPAQEPGYRRRALSLHSGRIVERHLPAVPTCGSLHRPSRPMWNDPTPHLHVRRFPIACRAEDDPRTLQPTREQVGMAQPARGRSDDGERAVARYDR